MRLGDIGAFLAMALFARRIAALSRPSLRRVASVAVTACGTALITLVLVPQGFARDDRLGGRGLQPPSAGGTVLLVGRRCFCQMGTTSMVVYGGGSCIVAFLVYCLAPR